ncbi:MAG: TolC family protein [Acidobacteria bacterium]|nr:TolC family protein [Acidobacteriota bacterium]
MISKTRLALFLFAILAWGGRTSARAEDPKTDPSPPPVRLADVVREALDRNPEIQEARRNVDARRARIPQAKAWPDPTVTLGYGGNLLPPYTLMRGDPSSQRQFMAEQTIPYPGKTRLRGQIAAREAEAEATTIEEASRRITAEVKQTYFDLYSTDRALATILLDRQVLQKLAKVAEIRYSVGKAAQQDVIQAQLELSRLTERQTMLEQTRQTLEAQLNSLRDLPVDSPVGPVEEIRQSALPQTMEELQSAAVASFPVLKRRQLTTEREQLAVNLARREVRPDFSVGYTYMQRDGMPDMYGITFSTSLPIFRRSKQDQAIREAAYSLEASRRGEANQLTLLRYRVKQDFLEAQAAARLLGLYGQALVPQSKLALESSLASYETGAIDFQAVLGNFTTVFEYELNVHQQLATHEKALARLEELTGLELVR